MKTEKIEVTGCLNCIFVQMNSLSGQVKCNRYENPIMIGAVSELLKREYSVPEWCPLLEKEVRVTLIPGIGVWRKEPRGGE